MSTIYQIFVDDLNVPLGPRNITGCNRLSSHVAVTPVAARAWCVHDAAKRLGVASLAWGRTTNGGEVADVAGIGYTIAPTFVIR